MRKYYKKKFSKIKKLNFSSGVCGFGTRCVFLYLPNSTYIANGLKLKEMKEKVFDDYKVEVFLQSMRFLWFLWYFVSIFAQISGIKWHTSVNFLVKFAFCARSGTMDLFWLPWLLSPNCINGIIIPSHHLFTFPLLPHLKRK